MGSIGRWARSSLEPRNNQPILYVEAVLLITAASSVVQVIYVSKGFGGLERRKEERVVSHVPQDRQSSVQEIRSLLAQMDVAVRDDEAESLAIQASPYFAMIDRLMRVPLGPLDPAVTFAIDRWMGANDE